MIDGELCIAWLTAKETTTTDEKRLYNLELVDIKKLGGYTANLTALKIESQHLPPLLRANGDIIPRIREGVKTYFDEVSKTRE